MPYMDLGDENGALNLYDFETVWATMAHPRDETARLHYMARSRERFAAEIEKKMTEQTETPMTKEQAAMATGLHLGFWLAPIGGFPTLTEAPPYPEVVERQQRSAWPGCAAGDVLLYLLQIDAAGIPSSVNKAVFVARDYLQGAKDGEGENIGASERYIRQCWEDFKPVAHLWAAYRVWQFNDDPEGREGPESFSPFQMDSLRPFLALSEKLADLGAAHVAHGRREPTLAPDQLWRVPERIQLPDVTFTIPSLAGWIADALKRYKAPSR